MTVQNIDIASRMNSDNPFVQQWVADMNSKCVVVNTPDELDYSVRREDIRKRLMRWKTPVEDLLVVFGLLDSLRDELNVIEEDKE